jgi:predicted transcriptional regulator
MSYLMQPDDIYNQMKVYVSNVDTSEKSYIYNSLYPPATVYSYLSLLMDQIENKVFASKAIISGYSDYLELRCAEIGILENKQLMQCRL